MQTIDLYLLKGCDHCDALRRDIVKLTQSGRRIPIGTSYVVNETDTGYVKTNNDGVTTPVVQDIHHFPYIEVHDRQGKTGLQGNAAISFIKDGMVHDIKRCPVMKGKKCMGNQCMWWRETSYNGILYGGCSVAISSLISLEAHSNANANQ